MDTALSSEGRPWQHFEHEEEGKWWCCLNREEDSFTERTPGVWKQYYDPERGPYWYHSGTEEFFYVHDEPCGVSL